MYDLTIIIPGIRTENWNALYQSTFASIGNFTWEMIFIGPVKPDFSADNLSYVEDYSTPARCVQIASIFAKGKFLVWASDDGVFTPNGLEYALNTLINSGQEMKNQIAVKYLEGPNFRGDESKMPNDYYRAHHHASLRLAGIPDGYKIAPVGMCATDLFREIGGLDTRFEHINMCCHDLSFRIQRDGGEVLLSPTIVLNCDKQPSPVVEECYVANDLPLFDSIYNNPNALADRHVVYNNWKDTPPVWQRRFKVERIR